MTTGRKTKRWADWAIWYIRRTGRCPGDSPPSGTQEDRISEEDFKQMLSFVKLHDHETCPHFRSEVLGTQIPEEMEEITGHGAAPVTEEDLERGKARLAQEGPSSTVDLFKRELHTYVDMIELREGGSLYIPSQLLKFDSFLKEFFEVESK